MTKADDSILRVTNIRPIFQVSTYKTKELENLGLSLVAYGFDMKHKPNGISNNDFIDEVTKALNAQDKCAMFYIHGDAAYIEGPRKSLMSLGEVLTGNMTCEFTSPEEVSDIQAGYNVNRVPL